MSRLADGLLAEGWQNIVVVDLSQAALQLAQARLFGCRDSSVDNQRVHWLVGDITQIDLPENYFFIWHDRAVFHFLTASSDRQKYVKQIQKSLKVGGHLILATFSLTGPETCSGLPVVRYDANRLQAELGSCFYLLSSTDETHHTPWDTAQEFIYCHWQKTK